ncbi:MAG: hypothetical protein O7C59_10280 [Rickettsia endosymbiont of Ixodes persulcatus]|nr:hypothetical protein [Rickettsia endosymbiont of Ixodes persulcatus]
MIWFDWVGSRVVLNIVVYVVLVVFAVIILVLFGFGFLILIILICQFSILVFLFVFDSLMLVNYLRLGDAGFGWALVVTVLMTVVILLG